MTSAKSGKFGLMAWAKAAVAVAGLGSVLLLSACNSDDAIDDRLGLSKPSLRVVHAFPNGPKVDFLANGNSIAAGADYLYTKPYGNIDDVTTTVIANLAGTTTQVSSSGEFKAATGHKYTYLFVAGTGAANDGVLIDDPYEKGLFSDKARVRAFNAAFNTGNVDIYFLKEGQSIDTATPQFAAVGFKKALPESGKDSYNTDGGVVRVVVTNAGSKQPIFTSQSVSLTSNADWLVTVLPKEGIASVLPDQIKVLIVKTGDTSGVELTPETVISPTPAPTVIPTLTPTTTPTVTPVP
ncbi:hypothetical protein IGB42_03897 [Andreprevotia sp. IGB-42]|uniref:DUF4397 domain-containing protein n=1 Tax=Andreprevotia sp. IGB-42 TaxID=2497473 RepID=UPI001359A20A|nr:DUF4397 domain-containing protein [Andreprevotia sp. IGB-42]KAF0811608.1 hypothetical protein IGB42_03897 [Andreprevotia sp. IGB-42]